jgi:MinD superfamily P-loop ATPase
VVTEPTVSGIQDLERILQMTRHFRLRTVVVVNKGDLNPAGEEEIGGLCRSLGVRVLGRIPFDVSVPEALTAARPVTEYQPGSPAARALGDLWVRLKESLQEELLSVRITP